MLSPLFPKFANVNGSDTHEIRVGYNGARLSINLDKVTPADCQPVASVEEAEDIVLALPTVKVHEMDLNSKHVPDCFAGILIQAMYYSNNIASCTRRGAGNVILMGRGVYQKVLDANQVMRNLDLPEVHDESSVEMVGRWESRGTANSTMRIYVGDAIPEDEVAVVYVGESAAIDIAGGLLEVNGDIFLRLLADKPNALANASDYIRRFRITTVNG